MARITRNYATDISTYDEIEKQARMMADGFSHFFPIIILQN